jgi:hypothetical protein
MVTLNCLAIVIRISMIQRCVALVDSFWKIFIVIPGTNGHAQVLRYHTKNKKLTGDVYFETNDAEISGHMQDDLASLYSESVLQQIHEKIDLNFLEDEQIALMDNFFMQ